jgi:ATP-binding protein involved in chromosome partitioning
MSDSNCKTCDNENCSAQSKRSNESEEDFFDRQMLQNRMCKIKNKVLVMSGKGGVGKSTVAVNIAASLALNGQKVGLVDVDIHGPSIPKLLGLEGAKLIEGPDNSIMPILHKSGLKVMSIGFFLNNTDEALIWRGPKKYGLIRQFLKDVDWGELDYLIFDLPPGTGDEPLAICQLIENPDGAVIVTTPQDVAITDVRKSVNFCRELKLPILGVVENMSGFVCPKCGELTHIFSQGGAKKMTDEMEIAYLGEIPIDPEIVKMGDLGKPFIYDDRKSHTKIAFDKIIQLVLKQNKENER